MENHSKKSQIKQSILNNWSKFTYYFKSENLINIVKNDLNIEYIYPDTILRYMRELKSDGKINYQCKDKKKREYLILKTTKK